LVRLLSQANAKVEVAAKVEAEASAKVEAAAKVQADAEAEGEVEAVKKAAVEARERRLAELQVRPGLPSFSLSLSLSLSLERLLHASRGVAGSLRAADERRCAPIRDTTAPDNTTSGRDCVKSLRRCLHGTCPQKRAGGGWRSAILACQNLSKTKGDERRWGREQRDAVLLPES